LFGKADSIFPSPFICLSVMRGVCPSPIDRGRERGRKKRERVWLVSQYIHPHSQLWVNTEYTVLFLSFFPVRVCVLCNDQQTHRGSLYKEERDGRATIKKTPYSEPVVVDDDLFFTWTKLPDGLAKTITMIPKKYKQDGVNEKDRKIWWHKGSVMSI